MPSETVLECRSLIDTAFGLIAQASHDLKDARGLIAIMEAEIAQAEHPALERLDPAEVVALRDTLDWDNGQVYLVVGEPGQGQQEGT